MTPEVDKRILELGKLCRARGWHVGLAESCTGGLLSSWLTTQAGVSNFYNGAVVSYARSVKESVLQVPKSLLLVHGEVSLPVALHMARGARRALSCDWAVGITGVAGPSGGSADKPVGFVCFGVVGPGFESSCHKQFGAHAGRQDIQRQAALFAFDFLLNAMR
ncbi:MAG: CinA family protein [Bdellovibrionales bacterium]